MYDQKNICEIVRKAEQEYTTGVTKLGKYVDFNLYENNEKIDAYINSRHTSGLYDSLGREKPFFNISIAARNIWYRATDIDRKNIKLKTSKQKQYYESLLANIVLQDWMRRINFGQLLNDWGRSLATYGSSMVEFVEKDGMLYCSVLPWNRLITDTVDVDNDVKIKILELTPAQLRKNKSYDKDVVKGLLNSLSARETTDKQQQDQKNQFVRVYEVHGELPLSLLTDNEDDCETYVQQMHVVSFVSNGKDSAGKTTYDDFTLFKGREEKDPMMITHLIKEDGRATGIGAVESLFESQWMVNHNAKAIKDQLDIASKLIFQTSDPNFVGRNVLTDIENGDIFTHAASQPLNPINNKADITALQGYLSQWQMIGNEIVGVSDAMRGQVKAGAAWRQTEALLQESHDLFELMTENKGLAIEEMMRRYILPFIKKKIDTAEEISATLSGVDLEQLDSMYIPNEAIRRVNKKILSRLLDENRITTPEEQMQMTLEAGNNLKDQMSKYGGQRFIRPSDIPDKTWKEIFKNLEWDIEVDPTKESRDSDAVLTTLTNVFSTLADPNRRAVLQTPEGKMVFSQIMEEVGTISPVQLNKVPVGQQPISQPNQEVTE